MTKIKTSKGFANGTTSSYILRLAQLIISKKFANLSKNLLRSIKFPIFANLTELHKSLKTETKFWNKTSLAFAGFPTKNTQATIWLERLMTRQIQKYTSNFMVGVANDKANTSLKLHQWGSLRLSSGNCCSRRGVFPPPHFLSATLNSYFVASFNCAFDDQPPFRFVLRMGLPICDKHVFQALLHCVLESLLWLAIVVSTAL